MSRKDHEVALSVVKPEKILFDFEAGTSPRGGEPASPGAPRATHAIEVADGGKALGRLRFGPRLGRLLVSGHREALSLRAYAHLFSRPRAARARAALHRVDGGGRRPLDCRGGPRGVVEELRTFSGSLPCLGAPPGRGKKGDRLRVENATRITFGLALSTWPSSPGRRSSGSTMSGRPRALPEAAPAGRLSSPRLESLCPGDLFYP